MTVGFSVNLADNLTSHKTSFFLCVFEREEGMFFSQSSGRLIFQRFPMVACICLIPIYLFLDLSRGRRAVTSLAFS